MSNLDFAKTKVEEAKQSIDPSVLQLSGKSVELTNPEWKELISYVQKRLPGLIKLDISEISANPPAYLAKLTKLRQLIIKGKYEKIPDLSGLKNLKYLTLRGGKLSGSLHQIQGLKRLHGLDLLGNEFKKIPEVVYSLKGLRRLQLAHNDIRMVSSEIFRIPEVLLSNNKISRIVGMPAFEISPEQKIDLCVNDLEILPEWLLKCFQGKSSWSYLRRNPFGSCTQHWIFKNTKHYESKFQTLVAKDKLSRNFKEGVGKYMLWGKVYLNLAHLQGRLSHLKVRLGSGESECPSIIAKRFFYQVMAYTPDPGLKQYLIQGLANIIHQINTGSTSDCSLLIERMHAATNTNQVQKLLLLENPQIWDTQPNRKFLLLLEREALRERIQETLGKLKPKTLDPVDSYFLICAICDQAYPELQCHETTYPNYANTVLEKCNEASKNGENAKLKKDLKLLSDRDPRNVRKNLKAYCDRILLPSDRLETRFVRSYLQEYHLNLDNMIRRGRIRPNTLGSLSQEMKNEILRNRNSRRDSVLGASLREPRFGSNIAQGDFNLDPVGTIILQQIQKIRSKLLQVAPDERPSVYEKLYKKWREATDQAIFCSFPFQQIADKKSNRRKRKIPR